ncbi:retrovirus-related pol polyprotein from transposon TNT 1-94, partial [Tanacetum coccineum]
PQSLEDAVADDAGKKTNEKAANEGERNGQDKEGASNKEDDQNVPDFRAELDNLLVQQKEGYANSTNRDSTVSPSVSTAKQIFTNADDLPTDPLMHDLEDTANLLNTGIFSGAYDDEDVCTKANLNNLETTMNVSPIPITRIHKDHPKDQIIGDINLATQTRRMTKISKEHAMRLVDLPKGKHAIGTKWVYRKKKDERGIIVRNKARLVAQGFIVYQMDVKSAFLYGTIEEEVYVCQPPGFEDPQFPDKVYKKFDFATVKIASTPIETNKSLLKDEEAEDVDVHLYRSIIGLLIYSPFELEAFSDSDYVGASLDRKSTTGGCQFLGKRLISWQCKKQTIVANSTTKAEYVAAANCCRQSSRPIPLVTNETVIKEWEDRMERVATTASSLEAEQDSVDGKTVVISKSSVRSDLHFNDEGGITCLTNDATFENLALMGYESDSNKLTYQKAIFSPQWKYLIHTILHCLSSKSTSWNEFSTNIASAVICLANGQKFNFSKLIFDDETIFKEWDDRVVRATATAASLDAAQASGNGGNTPGSDEERLKQDDLMDFVPPTPYDSPLSGGYTPGSDEGRPNINELMAICTNLSNMVLALEQSKTAQDLVIQNLKKKVKRLEKKQRARTPEMKLFKIGTSKRKSLDKENVSKQGRKSDKTKPMFEDSDFAELDIENVEGDAETQGRNTAEHGDTVNTASINVSVARPSNVSTADPSTSTAGDIFENEMVTIADTLVAIRSTRPRTASVVIHDVEEEPRRATPVPTVQSQDKVEEVYVEALQVKYPIIDWEVYSQDTRRYWKIIRVGNHTEAYQIFAKMLKKFDRDNLVKLWDLVKERFSKTEPTNDKEKELWVELKRLFKPDNDDIL